MKRFLKLIILTICSFLLVSCDEVSHYQAFMLTTNTKDNELSVSFEKLKGTLIKKINNTNENDGMIYYEVTCENGSYQIYYKINDDKELLVSVDAGDNIKKQTGYIESREDVIIYIVADEGAKGKIKIYLV